MNNSKGFLTLRRCAQVSICVIFLSAALSSPVVSAESGNLSPTAPEPPAAAQQSVKQSPLISTQKAVAAAIQANPQLTLAPAIVGGTWTAQGPAPTTNAQVQNLTPNNSVAGSVHAVVPHPTDPDIMYVGAVNGGIWRTNNATAGSPSWTPLTDTEQSLSIGALEMDPANPLVLLAGIGRFSSFGGDPPFQVAGGDLNGLLLTTDGGNNWTPITDPLLVGEHISAVAARGNILLAGANNFFGGGGTGGLFRSVDTGASWNQISGAAGTGLPAGTVDDMAGDPGNSQRFYLALEGNGIYRSDDSGANWALVSGGDATLNAAMGGSTNTRIAVGSNTGRVFVLVTSSPGGSTGVTSYVGYSDDQGGTWTQMDVPGTAETALQGRDELMSLAVDPGNASDDLVYVGAISQRGNFDTNNDNVPDNPNSVGAIDFHAHLFRGDVTRAQGLTGTVSNQWDHLTHTAGAGGMANGGTASNSAPHADSRAMAFDANGNLIEVSDGGVNRRTSPADNTGDWFSINGDIQVAELHSVAYDSNLDIILGGTQDTGAIQQTAPASATWNSVRPNGFQADGGKVAIDDTVAGISELYFSTQRLGGFTRRTCNPACVDTFPPLAGRNTGQFYTPLAINANNPARLLLGTQGGLSESMDQGNTASIVPGSAVTANSDARMVYGHASDPELIYVGSGNQVFVRTTANGVNLAPTTGAFPGGTVYGVAVDPADADSVYAIGNSSVYESVDGGDNWTDISGNITDDGAGTFRSIAYITGTGADRLVVGTNAGVFLSFSSAFGEWLQLGTGIPNAPVWDLDHDATDDVLVAGTLGRGGWMLSGVAAINVPPVAQCQDATVSTDPGQCSAAEDPAVVDDGSFDPDGTITLRDLVPDGPYPLGTTPVTLTVTDNDGATDSCTAQITVEDNEPPVVQCNVGSGTIAPPDAPISFTAGALDNCAAETDVTVVINSFDCFKFTKKGKRIDKTESCEVSIVSDDTITILDSGGVDDNIVWNVTATDGSGNSSNADCGIVVVNPAGN
jgi:hypothetical protein